MTDKKGFSFLKGFSFFFEEGGRKIEAWFSALTGLEKVFIDGEQISIQRSFSTNSIHNFIIGETQYSINLKAISLIKGPFVCTLSKNGVAYKRQKIVFPQFENLLSSHFFSWLLLEIAIIIIAAFIIAVIAFLFRLPPLAIYLSVAVVTFWLLWKDLKKFKNNPPYIVDEIIE